MINGLGVLGWGVGGIEAEVSMLDESSSMILPEVIGVKISGAINEGVTATDIVLNIVNTLRKTGVVGKFVEFYGDGLDELSLADRATIANMAPEYGATCGFFPIDKETTDYLELTGRPKKLIQLVEDYAKKQGLWRSKNDKDPEFTKTINVDLSKIETTISGPERPEDTVKLSKVKDSFNLLMQQQGHAPQAINNAGLDHGSVVVAAITSCTNTSNPAVMIAAGLIAKKAVEKGMTVPDHVKTSLAPGSQVVTDYLVKTGLQPHLDQLGFHTVGYGCTSCIGNSGPLRPDIQKEIDDKDLIVSSVSSGNRNFPGRVHGATKASYLASPPLIIAYALSGSVNLDLTTDPLGQDKNGNDVYLRDLWPTSAEISKTIKSAVNKKLFQSRYNDVFKGPEKWQKINTPKSLTYSWDKGSTYIQSPPYFENINQSNNALSNISGARALAIFGNDITTDHISPAGAFKAETPAGKYLSGKNIPLEQFNSYGSRRGNHEVMMRGTYANPRIKNTMMNGKEGGFTIHIPSGKEMSIFDAAMKYKNENTPVVVFAGKNLGKGSSRDWAAKGPSLLGVKAVIAESYERIHRSNLVGMGIIPLQFEEGTTLDSLGLTGNETYDIKGLDSLAPGASATLTVKKDNGQQFTCNLITRVDTNKEVEFIKHGGILNRTVKAIAGKSTP
jgi:aconitate hydratase